MGAIEEVLQAVSSERIGGHIRNLEGVRHPIAAQEALEAAADYVWSQLQSWGYKMSVHRFRDGEREYRNIIGTRQGTRQPEKRVIVIAHFDTVSTSPGANDNASGVAAMLELARTFRRLKFGKSVQYVGVNLEEGKGEGEEGSQILRGSTALAEHARASGWEIEGVVNFEEIAYAGEMIKQTTPAGLPLELPEVGNFIAVVGNEQSAGMVKGYIAGIERHRIPLPYQPLIVPGNGEMLPDTRRSDHAPFWDRGYRAIMLTDTADFRTPHYHQPSDTLETLNLAFAANVCWAAGCLVLEMAGYEHS